jgi:hypothetical protein
MFRKDVADVLCQEFQSFFSLNNKKVKEDKKVNKDKLAKEIQQRLVSANSGKRILAEYRVKNLQSFLDDENNKLSDEERAEIVLMKKDLEKLLNDFVELSKILIEKEEYVKKDLDEINAKINLIDDFLDRVDFFCLKRKLADM